MNIKKTKAIGIKIVFALYSILFLFSAAVQYNDPDPLHWMFLYGFAAILCILALFDRINQKLILICLGAVLMQMMIVLDGAVQWLTLGTENILTTPMTKEKPYIEEIREFFGTSIVLSANLLLLYFKK